MRCQTYSISPLALLCPQPARLLPPTAFFQQWSSAPPGTGTFARRPVCKRRRHVWTVPKFRVRMQCSWLFPCRPRGAAERSQGRCHGRLAGAVCPGAQRAAARGAAGAALPGRLPRAVSGCTIRPPRVPKCPLATLVHLVSLVSRPSLSSSVAMIRHGLARSCHPPEAWLWRAGGACGPDVGCGAAGESFLKSEVSMVVSAQLLPCGRPAVHADRDGPGRVVMRVSIRSAFPHVIAALQADVHSFVQELFEGAAPRLLLSSCSGPGNVSQWRPDLLQRWLSCVAADTHMTLNLIFRSGQRIPQSAGFMTST